MNAPDAFREQLLAAIPRLRRYARSLVFDTHAADDLVQTALERALAHWHQFDQRRDILVWVIAIAHNAYMDDRRKNARLMLVESRDGVQHAEHEALYASAGADIGLRIDLMAALRRLSPEHREPLLLVTLEQFTYAECAEALGVPIGTVMSRISRGRVALRALLEGAAPAACEPSESGGHTLRRVV